MAKQANNGGGRSESEERLVIEGTAGLAAHLGISRWTVSRVLNGHEGVRAATRERVLRAMAELGFEPNLQARGLKGVRSGLIGVSFPHLDAQVLAQKSQVLHRNLREAGYRAVFEMPEGDPAVEAEVVRHFLSIGVDGVVLIGSKLTGEERVLADAQERGVRMVAIDPVRKLPVVEIRLDRRRALRELVLYLYGLGHREFGFLGIRTDDLYGEARLRGLKAAASELGLEEGRSYRWYDAEGYSLQDYGYGAELGRRVMADGSRAPRALVCLNDRIAIGAMRTLQDAGKRVPEDFAVAGFDNVPEAAWSRPGLTTVDHNIEEMMWHAGQLLLAGDKRRNVRLAPILKIRGSTAGMKAEAN